VLPKHNKKAGDSGGNDTPLIANNEPSTPPVPESSPLLPESPQIVNPPLINPLASNQPPSGFHANNNPFPITPQPLPQPQPPGEPPPPNEVRVHIVAAHETLGEISMKYYKTSRNWKKIAEANKVEPSELQVGMKLTIPVIESSPVISKDGSQPAGEPAPGEHLYKVKTGDSYYNIAKRELGNANRWKELEKLNGIPAEELHAGQTIKLPVKEGAPAPGIGLPQAPPGAGDNPAPVADGRTHVVAKGDTLAEISKKYYGTTTKWKEIVKLNPGVDPESLKVGQKLTLPEGASLTPAAPNPGGGAAAPAESGSGFGEYTVQSGDTLESIAVKELGGRKGVKRIIEANPGLDPSKMRLGQKLKIPGKTKPPEPAAPAPVPGPAPGSFGPQPGFGTPSPAPAPSFGPPGAGLGPSLPPAGGAFGTPSYPAPPGPAVQPTFGTPTPAKPAFTQ